MRLKKIILVLVFLCFSTPLYAGMEPFWRGEWDMTQQQITALYDGKPVAKGFLNRSKTPYVNYELEILGAKAVVQYQFTKDDKLFKVLMDITTPKLSGAEAMELIDELGKLIVAPDEPFEHCMLEPNLNKSGDAYIAQWINATYFIDMTAALTVKSRKHLIYLRFWDNRDGNFRSYFDELQANIKEKEQP